MKFIAWLILVFSGASMCFLMWFLGWVNTLMLLAVVVVLVSTGITIAGLLIGGGRRR